MTRAHTLSAVVGGANTYVMPSLCRVVVRWYDTVARKLRFADLERIASRSISRGGSYPLRVIPEQLPGSPTLWIEATASLIHGRDLREHAPTTKSEHDGSRSM